MLGKKEEYIDISEEDIFSLLENNSILIENCKFQINILKNCIDSFNIWSNISWATQREKKAMLKEVGDNIGEILNDIFNSINKGIKQFLNFETMWIYKNKVTGWYWDRIISASKKLIPCPQKPLKPTFSWFDKLFRPKFRKEKMLKYIQEYAKYERDLKEWENNQTYIEKRISELKEAFEVELPEIIINYLFWMIPYSFALDEIKEDKIIDKIIEIRNFFLENLNSKEPLAVEQYFTWVIENIPYPWNLKKRFDLFFNKQSNILLINYCLPLLDDIPNFKEAKYIASKNQIKIIYFKQKELEKLYNDFLYQITLRTIYEVFLADELLENYSCLESIVFNGFVDTIDKRTGHKIKPCILTIYVKKSDFLQIDINNIDAKECFRYLKGIGSPKLHLISPVPPIMQINKEDDRFVEGYSVLKEVHEGYNLAIMDWLDFENLIRELFEKEFSLDKGEVKITRASRDRGVDAVVFNPDPIKGGKIVIQAKRYTNIVDVSSVRDLYGTIVNEGASKGILITTSDFGPDAYEFAKDKPITLINGAGLLYLLKKHGYKAYIDIEEAKKILKGKN